MVLVHQASEQITVSGSELGITAALLLDSDSQPLNVLMGTFEILSGGFVYHSENADGLTLSNTGANGEHKELIGSKWEIWGREDLTTWAAIKGSGESDAILNINLYGAA